MIAEIDLQSYECCTSKQSTPIGWPFLAIDLPNQIPESRMGFMSADL